MEREQAVQLVNEAISREYNSVSSYVLHSSPYTTPEDAAALGAFAEIRDAQAATASWLTTRLREDFGAGPTLRAFEYWKRDLNYLSVPYLARFAVEHFVGAAAAYGGILERAGDDPKVMAIFGRLRDEARAHAARLGEFVPKWTEPPREGPPAPADAAKAAPGSGKG